MYSVTVKRADWINSHVWNQGRNREIVPIEKRNRLGQVALRTLLPAGVTISGILKVFPNNRHLQIDSAYRQLLDRRNCEDARAIDRS